MLPKTLEIFEDIRGFSEVVADAIIKRTMPINDDLSMNECRKMYGKQWVSDRIAGGQLSTHKTKGKIIISRHECECLRLAERTKARLMDKDKAKQKKVKIKVKAECIKAS